MTADELRRLSEIAGIEVKYSDFEGCFLYEENYAFFSWQPHLRIEQAMMVADTFYAWELHKEYPIENYKDISKTPCYSCVLYKDNTYTDRVHMSGDTISLAICRAALAAKEV